MPHYVFAMLLLFLYLFFKHRLNASSPVMLLLVSVSVSTVNLLLTKMDVTVARKHMFIMAVANILDYVVSL